MALLVVIGALADGRKVVLAVESGQRESSVAWLDWLRHLKARGLRSPRLVVADGHLGTWGCARADLARSERAAVLESQAAECARPGAAQEATGGAGAVAQDQVRKRAPKRSGCANK